MIKAGLLLFSFFIFRSLSFGQAKPVVVATINIIADMAQNVAGNDLEVRSLLPAGTDPHTYEPTPKDASLLSKADLILKNGLNLEGWLDKLIAGAETHVKVGVVSARIQPITASEFHNSYDPHAWMSLPNARLYVLAIDSILGQNFPEFRAHFSENAQNYIRKIEATDLKLRALIDGIPERQRYLITSHDAFRYFSKTYNFQVASIMGTSTDADIQLKDINHLIHIVREFGVPAIFVEVAINPKTLKQIASDLGISIGGKLFTDSFGPQGSVADSYLKMMVFNVETMHNALISSKIQEDHGKWTDPLGLILVVFAAFALAYGWVLLHLYPEYKNEANWKEYLLEISNLSVMVERKMILSNIFLQLQPGRLYGLLGANGSGKSTLVKTIVGLYEPISGSIQIHNKPVGQFLRKIAYLPQKEEFDMDFPATVEDVVKLGFFPSQSGLGGLNAPQKAQLETVLDKLEIKNLRDRQISQLSGGQFQRTLLARALCQKAEIFILDEPFVGVDHATEEIIIELLKQLAQEGKLVLMVHHDLTKVRSYFDHLIMINQRIIASGPVDEVFTEENIQATYSGKVTLLQKALQLIKPQSS